MIELGTGEFLLKKDTERRSLMISHASPHSELETVVIKFTTDQSIDGVIQILQEMKKPPEKRKIEKGSKVRRVGGASAGPPIGCKGVVRERDGETAEVIWRGWYEGWASRKGGPPNGWSLSVQDLELLEDVK